MTRFDWAAVVLGAAFTGGLYLDGWAHTHGRVDDTFFTPWHTVLYSGFLALALLLIGRAAWGFRRAGRWRGAMPRGYGLGLVGVGCWFVGGPFDALWHSIFGFEASVEALMSPAHAILALGFGLMASGPLRAGLQRPSDRWRDKLAIALSMTFVVANLTFFTQIAHPVSNMWAAGYARMSHDTLELGITGLLLTAAILSAPVLMLLRWNRLPAGGVTILVGLDAIATGFLFDRGPYPLAAVLAMILGAALADVLRACLSPSVSRPWAFRVFAVAQPVLLYAAYFAALGATSGLGWSTHLWLGVVVFAGVIGWLLSYLVLPPRVAPV
jgi:hypothetical protein